MKITIDTDMIGNTTLKCIRSQLILESMANDSSLKHNHSDALAAYRVELRRKQTYITSAISALNVAIDS